MRVILLKDVDKIGKKYEVKEVKAGFARNFLIPKGLAKKADKQVLRWVEIQREIVAKKSEEDLKKVQELASNIDGQELVFQVRVGEKKQLFETITSQRISDKLKEMGFKVKKSQIDLLAPIRQTGEFPVKVHFEHGLEAEIKVIVTEGKD